MFFMLKHGIEPALIQVNRRSASGCCTHNPIRNVARMTPSVTDHDSTALIEALRDPARHAQATAPIRVLETHISWVILTGQHAYKIKKPVDLDFLDFTSLEARRRYCEEELRLNRRFAPGLYEAVVKITDSVNHPIIDGIGPAIEYAVKMREFPQSALASRMLTDGSLTPAHIDAFAQRIAAFHATAEPVANGASYGKPSTVIASARDNFVQLAALLPQDADQSRIAELRSWTEQEYAARQACIYERYHQGAVRECHGDLHLGNLVLLDDALVPFDCIEFDPALRWIDVINEVAFVAMDLLDRGAPTLGWRFLNRYLEASGDYAGLQVLRFYVVYRALVRAKVHALRAAQAGVPAGECERLMDAARGYLALARQWSRHRRPAIVLMHGYSGSGKSAVASASAENIGGICVRSDVERKRIASLAPTARSGSALDAGLYAEGQTAATYQRLLELARLITEAGYAAIVDATFLQRWQRELFCQYARAHHLPWIIADVIAPEATLRARISERLASGLDASEADASVLSGQIANAEALSDDERTAILSIDTECDDRAAMQRKACLALQAWLDKAYPGTTL